MNPTVTSANTSANATQAAQLAAENARLAAELAALKAEREANHRISLKVSDKGAVSLYGLGRFPVTLYKEQWERVLDHTDDIRTFLASAKGLKLKGQ